MSSEQPTAEHRPEPLVDPAGAATPEPIPDHEPAGWAGDIAPGMEASRTGAGASAGTAAWGEAADGLADHGEGAASWGQPAEEGAASWRQPADGFAPPAEEAAPPGGVPSALAERRPELLVGGAFAGGVLLALIVRRLRG